MTSANRGNPNATGNPDWVAPRIGAGKWVDSAITQVPKAPASVSWWLEAKTREEFTAKVKAETPRMTASRFGSVTRLIGE